MLLLIHLRPPLLPIDTFLDTVIIIDAFIDTFVLHNAYICTVIKIIVLYPFSSFLLLISRCYSIHLNLPLAQGAKTVYVTVQQ